MGVDICGLIECRHPLADRSWYEGDAWQGTVGLDMLYQGRDYDLFGCLFGVQNFAHFRPVAAHRGLPPEPSSRTRHAMSELSDEVRSTATWVSRGELQAVDPEEAAELPDSRIHVYRREAGGELVYETKAAWDAKFAAVTRYTIGEGVTGARTWPEGQEWEIDGKVYRSERLRRREALAGFGTVFEVMKALALTCGDEGVRLVVWFTF